ncbi:midnolin-like isoform X2 [Lineus longissimus]|uniref:midnolin-like isoform X2 n=1 Tax=Lineus longissimus TaxID=88925 RepID=UPI00315DE2F1
MGTQADCKKADSTSCAQTLGPMTPDSNARVRLIICPIAGGHFELIVSLNDTVEGLRKAIANRLKVHKERIHLLYKQRVLKEGSLAENAVLDGGKITLLPNVESGLAPQKAEQGVMQALDHLSESQVTDFLSGKSPLTLMMRLGDHMMFVELQLSTTPQNVRRTMSVSSPIKPTASRPIPQVQSLPTPALPREATTCTASPKNVPILDGSAIAKASRNLSQRLKELSHTSFSNKIVNSTATPPCQTQACTTSVPSSARSPGAIIESMYHHGQGVFSGTFSGTLNPTLQDKDGRPRKDINTIIHILNDLLGAAPQYRNGLKGSPSQLQRPMSPVSPTSPSSPRLDPGSKENRATRGKMEQIRQMLEERRHRRRVKRELRACPYSAWAIRQHHHLRSQQGPAAEAMDRSVSDTKYMELNGEPVVA